MKLNKSCIVFTGGGTAGHIYPGLAVAEQLKSKALLKNEQIKIVWIGCSKGMDKKIVESSLDKNGSPSVESFIGIPSGKLRRYFSLKNFSDLFRIMAGFFCSLHYLRKIKPAALFSKGGFVSVPPVFAARLLGIPVYTHECDFTLGLANRINFKSAYKMFVSYQETKNSLNKNDDSIIVTGNPVRPVFYEAEPDRGFEFLNIEKNHTKPILLVLGGSSGARQINNLVKDNLEWLCKNFIVVHQTGLINSDSETESGLSSELQDSYKPYQFIYSQMPDVLACADVVLSRAGANSIWEAAVLKKPMVLVPLCGNGSRGDQVDNAKFFYDKEAAELLLGKDATSENLINCLNRLLNIENRNKIEKNIAKIVEDYNPAEKIAEIILTDIIN